MSEPRVPRQRWDSPTVQQQLPLPPTYIGKCCREWVLAYFATVGRCGLCGERPTYLREDE